MLLPGTQFRLQLNLSKENASADLNFSDPDTQSIAPVGLSADLDQQSEFRRGVPNQWERAEGKQ